MKSKDTDRKARLYYVEHLLFQKRYGWTIDEIADKCDVNARTTRRDLEALERSGVPLYQNSDKWCVKQDYYLPPVHFTRPEAMSIFLASRLMLSYAHRSDPYIKSAFYKLNCVVPSPLKEQILNTIEWMQKLPRNDMLVRHIAILAEAWTKQQTVKINYHTFGEDKPKTREIDTYFIQPAAIGHSIYVIAYCHLVGEIRLFKIERIKSIEITKKTYRIPDSFNANEYLSASWGVVAGGDAETVKLRFSPAVAQILGESVWHPSQTVETLEDGSLLMTLEVVPSMELMGWILSWGEKVEVLEPKELREDVIDAVKGLAKLYK